MKIDVILVGINPYSGNKGVGALAYSTFYLLDKVAKYKDVEFNILIPSPVLSAINKDIRIGDLTVSITQFPLFLGVGIKGLLKFIFSVVLSGKILFKTKYVLDMSEGDSFSDIYGKNRFVQIISPKNFFRFLGKKQLLLPQTIGPFKASQYAKAANDAILGCDVVLTRDRTSYEYVVNTSHHKNVKESIDVAFIMPFTRRRFVEGKVHVGLNISSLLWHGGYTRSNQFGFKVDYQKFTWDVIRFFLEQPDISLHLIPHVVEPVSHVENDYELAIGIQQKINDSRVIVSPFFLDPIEAKNYISGLDFFAGSRMHACIAAFSSEIPVFPIAYSRKFNGLFGETLRYPFFCDLVSQTNIESIEGLRYGFEHRGELLDRIREALKDVVNPRVNSLHEELIAFFD